MTALAGIFIFAGSIAALWYMLPKAGKTVRLATVPFLESIIPLGIVAGIAVGLALVLGTGFH